MSSVYEYDKEYMINLLQDSQISELKDDISKKEYNLSLLEQEISNIKHKQDQESKTLMEIKIILGVMKQEINYIRSNYS